MVLFDPFSPFLLFTPLFNTPFLPSADVDTSLSEMLSHPLVLSAWGGLVSYLRTLQLDTDLISQRRFASYTPLSASTSCIVDGQTLANLEVFENSADGSARGTLFELLCRSVTPFGKRLFKRWLCHPLRSADAINARLDAVDDLLSHASLSDDIARLLRGIPDLERIISRIHALNCKVADFCSALQGFERAQQVLECIEKERERLKAAPLRRVCDGIPDMQRQLKYFRGAFSAEVARREGSICPLPGANERFDEVCERISGIKKKLQVHLEEQKRALGYEWKYYGAYVAHMTLL